MDEVILEVARAIRPYLADLVGDEAAEFDQRLVVLLGRARDGADVDDAILDLLTESPATHSWAASVIEDERHLPPDLQARLLRSIEDGGFSPLPNPYGGDPVDALRYVCPVDGSYVWWRTSVGQPVPTCPDHPEVGLVAG